MSTTSATDAVPTGNTYDKYGSRNPVVRRLMANFERTLGELFTQAAPSSVLDVGCGEGVLTHKWAKALGDKRIVGIDLDDEKLKAEQAKRQAPNTSTNASGTPAATAMLRHSLRRRSSTASAIGTNPARKVSAATPPTLASCASGRMSTSA